jgi:hypothetical protein
MTSEAIISKYAFLRGIMKKGFDHSGSTMPGTVGLYQPLIANSPFRADIDDPSTKGYYLLEFVWAQQQALFLF